MKHISIKAFSLFLAMLILTSSIGISKITHECLMNVYLNCNIDEPCCETEVIDSNKDACCSNSSETLNCCNDEDQESIENESNKCCKDQIRVITNSPVFFSKTEKNEYKPLVADLSYGLLPNFLRNNPALKSVHQPGNFHAPPLPGKTVLISISQFLI